MSEYQRQGFVLIKGFLAAEQLAQLSEITDKFHSAWLQQNREFYRTRAINSAYLTASETLNEEDKLGLFQLICEPRVSHLLEQLPIHKPAFMNTQLFFNPANPKQNNYWHRDSQYHLNLEQQQLALSGPEIVHFRFALNDEPGIELIPGTHKHWDNEQELDVRLERNGNKSHQNLSRGLKIELSKGDLLIFSANMIHRGLYGKDRKALDVILFEATPDLAAFANPQVLPSEALVAQLPEPSIFSNTWELCQEQKL